MLERPAHCSRCLPTAVEPVNTMPSTSMCSASGSPAPLPNPGNTLNTPGGMPASIASSAIRIAVSGDFSDGLRITELPIASAGAIFQIAISNGKFQGTIAAMMPSGSRVTIPSSSGPVGAISSYTLSMASPVQLMQRTLAGRSTLRASPIGLPMSRVSSSASSSQWLSSNCAKRISTFLRCTGAVADQRPSSNARRDTLTARSTSSASHCAIAAITRPSIGLMQSKVCPEAAST